MQIEEAKYVGASFSSGAHWWNDGNLIAGFDDQIVAGSSIFFEVDVFQVDSECRAIEDLVLDSWVSVLERFVELRKREWCGELLILLLGERVGRGEVKDGEVFGRHVFDW